MTSRTNNSSDTNEFQDPRGAPTVNEDVRKDTTKENKTGFLESNKDSTRYSRIPNEILDDLRLTPQARDRSHKNRLISNIAANDDVQMINIEEDNDSYEDEQFELPSPILMNRPRGGPVITRVGGATTTTDHLILTPVTVGTNYDTQRRLYSPSDKIDTYKFRDLFPKPEHLTAPLDNRHGELDAGGAYVIDKNISMQGDLLMLNLDPEDKGHSRHGHPSEESFSQLTKMLTDTTPVHKPKTTDLMSDAQPVRLRAPPTTGIRHLLSIRNQDMDVRTGSTSSSSCPGNTDLKRTRRKKNSQLHVNSATSTTKRPKARKTKKVGKCNSTPVLDVVNKESTEAPKKLSIVKRVRQQLDRFGAYIKKKVLRQK